VTGPLEFRARTRVVAGWGCARQALPGELRALGARTVGVIADRGAAEAGLLGPLLSAVEDVSVPVCALIGVDPDVHEAEAAAQAALACGAEAVLTVGGGSALCAGKAVAIRLRNPAPLDAYEGRDRLPLPPAPTIAIPTTAGSGSEVSTVVVLHDPSRNQHLVIRGRGYEPDVALLDGSLLCTLPARPMVEAALDALSHAYEALWARRATPITDALALSAAAIIRTALPGALERDEEDLQQLIVASAMANLACGNAELGLVHALSSAPGVHLPHGYQNAALLPHVAAFNAPVLDDAAADEVATLPALYDRLGVRGGFAADDLSSEDAELMVAAALANPFLHNNRRPADERELRALMAAAGAPLT
jgi:alcohol dehydrogenase class IV